MTDIEILKEYYGFTTKEARAYKKAVRAQTIEAIKKDFENNAKRSFLED